MAKKIRKRRTPLSKKFIPQASIISDELYIPNHSGQLDAGTFDLTDGSVLFAIDGKIDEDNSNLFWDNTNKRFGIGTTTPTATFEIEQQGSAKTDGIRLLSVDGDSRVGSIYMDAYGQMKFDNPGDNVNIGGNELQVRANLLNLNNTFGLRVNDSDVTRTQRLMRFGTSADYCMGYYPTDDTFQIVDGDTINTNVRFVINSSGNVGIGTTTPDEAFTIGDGTGNPKLKIDGIEGATPKYLTLGVNTGGNAAFEGTFDQFVINKDFKQGDDYKHIMGAGGDYYFKYFAGTTKFEFVTSDGDGGGTDAVIWRVEDGTDDLLLVPNTGNVGIGTTTPDADLEVEGTGFPVIKITRTGSLTSTVGSGYNLHSRTTANMADGYGGGIVFSIEDGTSAEENIATIYAIRDGADDSGAITFNTYLTGSRSEQLRIDSNGNSQFTGAIASGTSTFSTTGPTDNVDVSGVNTLFVDTSSNNVTIGGFAGGVDGQQLCVIKTSTSNALILEDEEGGGSQDIFTHDVSDLNIEAGKRGGVHLICDGSDWYAIDLAH